MRADHMIYNCIKRTKKTSITQTLLSLTNVTIRINISKQRQGIKTTSLQKFHKQRRVIHISAELKNLVRDEICVESKKKKHIEEGLTVFGHLKDPLEDHRDHQEKVYQRYRVIQDL